MKAKNADTYAYVAEAFDDSPDYFVAGADLKNGETGDRDQSLPIAIRVGPRRADRIQELPKASGCKERCSTPRIISRASSIRCWSTSMNGRAIFCIATSRSPSERLIRSRVDAAGYFVLMPDIVFRARDPGLSVVECVTAATKKVLETGMVDPKRVGIVGHSWGGFGSAFTMTQTDCSPRRVAGGPLPNLVSSSGEIYWNTGVPETSHAEIGQERLEVPLWEDPQAYMRNSADFQRE